MQKLFIASIVLLHCSMSVAQEDDGTEASPEDKPVVSRRGSTAEVRPGHLVAEPQRSRLTFNADGTAPLVETRIDKDDKVAVRQEEHPLTSASTSEPIKSSELPRNSDFSWWSVFLVLAAVVALGFVGRFRRPGE